MALDPLAIASDGYLSKYLPTLSIASRGYMSQYAIAVIPVGPIGGGGGGGGMAAIELKELARLKDKERKIEEDNEIITLIQIFMMKWN
jgi:hypothetical protein